MRQSGTPCCMHSLRGLSHGLRTAIGHGGNCMSAQWSSGCRQTLQQCPLVPAATAMHATAQHRRGTAAAAAGDLLDSTQSSSSEDAAADISTSSSNGTGSSSRAVNEPIAAASTVASPPGTRGSGPASSSSSSSGTVHGMLLAGSIKRSVGPPRRNGPPVRRTQVAGSAAVYAPAPSKQQTNTIKHGSSSNNSSSSSGSSFGNASTGSSSLSTSGFSYPSSSASSASACKWYRTNYSYHVLGKWDLDTIARRGITALANWRVWGNNQLLQDWEEATNQLPAAVNRLKKAVSRNETAPLLTVFFDFETCGGVPSEPVELAAVASNGQEFCELICPLGRIPEDATGVHGLTFADVRHSPPWPVVLLHFVDWLAQQCEAVEGGRCRLVLAGHNIKSFDVRILGAWFTAFKLGDVKDIYWRELDTYTTAGMAMTFQKTNPVDNAKLGTLKNHFNVNVNEAGSANLQAHRALGDVLTNIQVFRHLAAAKLGYKDVSSLPPVDELVARVLGATAASTAATAATAATPGKQKQPPGTAGSTATTAAKGKQKQPTAQKQRVPVQEPEDIARTMSFHQQVQETVQVRQQLEEQLEWQQQTLQQQPPVQALPVQQQPSAQVPRLEEPLQQQMQQSITPVPQPQQQQQRQGQGVQQVEQVTEQDLQQQLDCVRERLKQQSLALAHAAANDVSQPGAHEQRQQLLNSIVQTHTELQQVEESLRQQQAAAAAAAAAAAEAEAATAAAEAAAAAQAQLDQSSSSSSFTYNGRVLGDLIDDPSIVDFSMSSMDSSSSGSTGNGVDLSNSRSSSTSSSSSKGSSSSSRERGSRSNIKLESTGSMGPVDKDVLDQAVVAGLESLPDQDITWIVEELSQAWPLLGDPVNPKDKILTSGLYDKLRDAGFENYMRVLQQTPSVVQYHTSIPMKATSSSDNSSSSASVTTSSSSSTGIASGSSSSTTATRGTDNSSSNGSSLGTEAEAGLSEDSIDGADEAGDSRPYVAMSVKCLAAARPRPSANGAVWSALFEAPTDPASAGPVAVLQTYFQPARYGAHGMVNQILNGPYAQAIAAAENGSEVLLKGRLKPYEQKAFTPQWQPKTPANTTPIMWEVTSAPAPEVSWDASDPELRAVVDGTAELLERQYPTRVQGAKFTQEDWQGSKRSKGFIQPLLDEVLGKGLADILPDELRQQHGFGDFAADLQEVHKPTSEKRYQQACRGIAMRELVLMQVAQLMERYRLTTAPAGVIAAAADVLLPGYPDLSDTETDQPAAAAADGASKKPKRAAGKRAPKRGAAAAGSRSAGAANSSDSRSYSTSATTTSSNSSTDDEDLPLGSRSRLQQALQPVRQLQEVESVQRGSAAYSVRQPGVIDFARQALRSTFGWDLTEEQQKALEEARADMLGPRAMLRLLQGDVGCGKTIVALLACLETAASGYQALLFAPTELLATQHYQTLEKLADELPVAVRPRIGLLTGSMSAAAKRSMKEDIRFGRINIVISTQAALWVDAWDKLALIVIDEQHKMGVKQRERLTRNVKAPPHMLMMTATPIPRTLAIMQYGGMLFSDIKSLPPGRTPVETHVLPDDEDGRHEVYAAIKQEIGSGGRAYIVCPLVSESGSDAMDGVRTVEAEFARLSGSGIFGDGSECGKLHGKMSAEEKAAVLDSFKRGQTHVLISSTVVEVGVDVPEASIMLVEGAHRFGLAQLHQLRGRVGRGSKASKCYLMAPAGDAKATERLETLERSHCGLDIAQADLDIRGPGDLWSGTKQSGKNSQLSQITMLQLEADPHIVEHARLAAARILLNISQNQAVRAALLASGMMVLREGHSQPFAPYGISGM